MTVRTHALATTLLLSSTLVACERAPAGDSSDALGSTPATPSVSGRAELTPLSSPRVRRQADRPGLVLAFADGAELAFDDDTTEGDRYVRHEDAGPLEAPGYHLVHRVYYEGTDFAVVHWQSGRVTALPDRPRVAPNLRRLAVASMDFDAGYAPTVLQVWRVGPDSLELEWSQETGRSYPANTGWGASDLRWVDDSTLAFTMTTPGGDTRPYPSAPARLVFRSGRWAVER